MLSKRTPGDAYAQELKESYLTVKPDFNIDLLVPYLTLLAETLDTIRDGILLISVGCVPMSVLTSPEQQIPNYIRVFAQNQKVTIILIDPLFIVKNNIKNTFETSFPEAKKTKKSKHSYQIIPNIDIYIFPFLLPNIQEEACTYIYEKMELAISTILRKGGKVFIGNHTDCYGLKDAPRIGILYNKIKQSLTDHAQNLQLYTQCGKKAPVRYLDDRLYDDSVYEEIDSLPLNPVKTCANIRDLCLLPTFSPLSSEELAKKRKERETEKAKASHEKLNLKKFFHKSDLSETDLLNLLLHKREELDLKVLFKSGLVYPDYKSGFFQRSMGVAHTPAAGPTSLFTEVGIDGPIKKDDLPSPAFRSEDNKKSTFYLFPIMKKITPTYLTDETIARDILQKLSILIRKITNLTDVDQFTIVPGFDLEKRIYFVDVAAAKIQHCERLDKPIRDALEGINDENGLDEDVTRNSLGNWRITISINNVLNLLAEPYFTDIEVLTQEQLEYLSLQLTIPTTRPSI